MSEVFTLRAQDVKDAIEKMKQEPVPTPICQPDIRIIHPQEYELRRKIYQRIEDSK